eukprot:285274-Chlamydomonas_euryale.AAC.2
MTCLHAVGLGQDRVPALPAHLAKPSGVCQHDDFPTAFFILSERAPQRACRHEQRRPAPH